MARHAAFGRRSAHGPIRSKCRAPSHILQGAQGGARVPGQAGELGARDKLAGGTVLLGGRVREHGRVLEQRDALGHASRGEDGAVAVKVDAGQDGRRLARARARQLRDHLRNRSVLHCYVEHCDRMQRLLLLAALLSGTNAAANTCRFAVVGSTPERQ